MFLIEKAHIEISKLSQSTYMTNEVISAPVTGV
jgi:hypothetical protein